MLAIYPIDIPVNIYVEHPFNRIISLRKIRKISVGIYMENVSVKKVIC